MKKIEQAWKIAATADVSTPPSSVVLYSVSYLPSDENKRLAMQYIAEHPESRTLDNTPCGQALIALGMETDHNFPDTELLKIWALASRRFIEAASGNVIAFVENADKRSTFVATELPQILKNPRILKINGTDKFVFAERFL
ncbi:MAG: hypothetical protein J6Y91_05715 [Alphaproteobacteria bacterium]|nr:hypothetical protein [Alphaproteobacteria bacterium]